MACQEHYRPFWKLGIPVDVIESLSDFTRYRLIVAPMLFMLKPGVVGRLEAFVKNGGTLLLTYLSGVVNETALVLRGGWPGGGLRKMAGVWSEEIDALYPNPPQRIVPAAGNALGMTGEHPVKDYCERVHPEGATVLATYKTDFYAGMPALTVNKYGAGHVYYLAARPAADPFLDALTRGLASQARVSRCLDVELPEGVTVQKRSGGGRTFYFLHNCRREDQVRRSRRHPAEGRQRRADHDRPHDAGAVRVVRARTSVAAGRDVRSRPRLRVLSEVFPSVLG